MLSCFIYCVLLFIVSVVASPTPVATADLSVRDYHRYASKRTYPDFPPDPPSCPICQKDYDNINSCADGAEVFANFSMIIFNPGAFIDIIQCACTDTFQSAFPQCLDCFQRTGQDYFIDQATTDPNDVVNGMRQVCALASSLIGNVSYVNGEATPTPSPVPNGISPTLGSPAYIFATLLALFLGSAGLIIS